MGKTTQEPSQPRSEHHHSYEAVRSYALLARALAWPIVALIGAIVLYFPVRDIVDTLIPQASRVTIAGVSVEVTRPIGPKPSNELKEALKDLPPRYVRFLISLRTYGHYGRSSDIDTLMLRTLESRQLIKVSHQTADTHGNDLLYSATALGQEVYRLGEDILIDLLVLWSQEARDD